MRVRIGRPREDEPWGARNMELLRQLESANRHPVRCRSCGRMDNDWPQRHGLCCKCWCRLLNGRLARGMTLKEAAEDAAVEAEAMEAGGR